LPVLLHHNQYLIKWTPMTRQETRGRHLERLHEEMSG
jgi:hypothetical protein